ncbi:MAG: TIGR00282 family metallophosphoesterase [Acidobacteria bacterium]|nr:TIGR00282 family metallophosphoesterase [Acidobacteriota bacterium]
MKLLFIGDIVGRPGRDMVTRAVKVLVRAHGLDLVIANGENAAAGAGLTRENATDIFKAGVHVITGGNHIWDKREITAFIDSEPRIVRPANYPAGAPGRGGTVVTAGDGTRVGVISVMGRVFMNPLDDPFVAAEREVARVRADGAQVILVDVHAEATSEKIAMGWCLDGLVTAVIGTHTHVQTADERILPGGTACLTDAGMTGPHDGVIGMDRAGMIARFRTAMPGRFDPATGDVKLHGVVVTADPQTGRAQAIERVQLSVEALDVLAQQMAAEVTP